MAAGMEMGLECAGMALVNVTEASGKPIGYARHHKNPSLFLPAVLRRITLIIHVCRLKVKPGNSKSENRECYAVKSEALLKVKRDRPPLTLNSNRNKKEKKTWS